MKSLDDLPVNIAVALYNDKHNALRQGDMIRLLELKKDCPDLFLPEKDNEIRIMLESVKIFKKSSRYKVFCKQVAKSRFSIINTFKET